jgi:hypothetical protein
MLRTRVLSCLAAFAAASARSACNGGSDEPGALSKAGFASKANAECVDAEAHRARLLQQLPAEPSGRGDRGIFSLLAGNDRYLIRRVDALVPPEAEQDRVDRVLDGWRQRAELEDDYAQAPRSLESFNAAVAQIDAATDPVAVQLGLTGCASTP